MKIGYNKYNITPNSTVNIAGYSRKKKSIGVLDPIEINTLVLSIQDQLIILSFLDSIIIEDSVITPVKNAISQKYNLSQSQIIIGCIHTHSAPAYFKPFFENVEVEEELHNQLIPQFIESIDKAIGALEEVNYSIQKATIDGLYGNRNQMNEHSDKNIISIHFTKINETSPFFTLLSMACHPTILDGSNLKLSADLFGALRLQFLNKYHHECMIINGCCGDVSTRFYRQLKGEEELIRVSQNIIEQMDTIENLDYKFNTICSDSFSQNFTFDGHTHEFTQTMIPQLKNKILQNPGSKETTMLKILLNSLELKVKLSPMKLSLKSNIILIGDVLFISLPGDITSKLGKRIKDSFPQYLVIIMGYCENYSNYFVCEEDYGKYFETYISRLDKGNADTFIQNVIDTAHCLIERQ